MARQFFVGGNFKLNPVSVEAKKSLLKVLNQADIDPAVGTRSSLNSRDLQGLTQIAYRRGRYCSPCSLRDPCRRAGSQGDQGLCPELLPQVQRCIHWRDQVRFDMNIPDNECIDLHIVPAPLSLPTRRFPMSSSVTLSAARSSTSPPSSSRRRRAPPSTTVSP